MPISVGQGSVKVAWVIGLNLFDAENEPADYDGALTLAAPDGYAIAETPRDVLNGFSGGAEIERGVTVWKIGNVPDAVDTANPVFTVSGDADPTSGQLIQTTELSFAFVAANVAGLTPSVLGSVAKPV